MLWRVESETQRIRTTKSGDFVEQQKNYEVWKLRRVGVHLKTLKPSFWLATAQLLFGQQLGFNLLGHNWSARFFAAVAQHGYG
jgi:hypothetical protein